MLRRDATRLLLAAPFVLPACLRAADKKPTPTETLLAELREKHGLPGLAVCVTRDDQVRDLAAVGVRKQGDPAPLRAGDRFHLGSCTKSMTATLAALLIERERLRWDSTVAECLPALRGRLDPGYAKATLVQLLQHRGGLPGAAPADLWSQAWRQEGTPARQRAAFVAGLLSRPPAHPPGTRFEYSNQGYAVAGHMLEIATGRPWEDLIRDELFAPLGMSTAGFGPPGIIGRVEEPWGHEIKNGRLLPDQIDNPPAIAPANAAHCSLEDLTRFTRLHLRRGRGKPTLLPAAAFRRLHTPPEGADYACGWLNVARDWAGGRALTHTGSNTRWVVVMWLAPERDFSVVVGTNVAGPAAEKACDEVCSAMISRWLKT